MHNERFLASDHLGRDLSRREFFGINLVALVTGVVTASPEIFNYWGDCVRRQRDDFYRLFGDTDNPAVQTARKWDLRIGRGAPSLEGIAARGSWATALNEASGHDLDLRSDVQQLFSGVKVNKKGQVTCSQILPPPLTSSVVKATKSESCSVQTGAYGFDELLSAAQDLHTANPNGTVELARKRWYEVLVSINDLNERELKRCRARVPLKEMVERSLQEGR